VLVVRRGERDRQRGAGLFAVEGGGPGGSVGAVRVAALGGGPPAETPELAPTIWRSIASILALMPTLCTDDWVERGSTVSSMRDDCMVSACAWSPDRPSRRMRRRVSSSRLRT